MINTLTAATLLLSKRLAPSAEKASNPSITNAADDCAFKIKNIFATYGIECNRFEVSAFLLVGMDFVFQTISSEVIYRRELNHLSSHLSATDQISRNEIAALARDRGTSYAHLISKVLEDLRNPVGDENESPIVQLAWELFTNFSGNRAFPPTEIAMELPQVALEYTFRLMKAAQMMKH